MKELSPQGQKERRKTQQMNPGQLPIYFHQNFWLSQLDVSPESGASWFGGAGGGTKQGGLSSQASIQHRRGGCRAERQCFATAGQSQSGLDAGWDRDLGQCFKGLLLSLSASAGTTFDAGTFKDMYNLYNQLSLNHSKM